MEKSSSKWHSVYVFYHGNADDLLKQFLHPFIQQWQSDWFFIRYWEGGSHIRLRLSANDEQYNSIFKSLDQQSKRLSDKHLNPNEIKVVSLQKADYEPEIERYGNAESIRWAEQQFQSSSIYILNWIVNKGTKSSVTVQAIKLNLVLLFALRWDAETLLNVCTFFLEGWLPKLYNQNEVKEEQRMFWLDKFKETFGPMKSILLQAADQFWQSLSKKEVDEDLNTYLSETIAVMHQYNRAAFEKNKIFQTVSSFMHMNNNRLGISNYEEAYIMYCTIQCIEFINEISIQDA